MSESFELILTVLIFGAAAVVIVSFMIYWTKNKVVVDERDRKYYQEVNDEKSGHSR